jgi:molybdopterin/thiamine biosynthesis adenylyltransferase
MPDALLDSRSEFDRTKLLLGRWLRNSADTTRALTRDELNRYVGHRFVAGWQLTIERAGISDPFDVLINGSFPYSPIRVAYRSRDVYLKWPHVEPGGLLCLPRHPAPSADLELAIANAISNAIALVDQCQDENFVREELRREFLSYWNRSEDLKAKRIRSLLDTANRRPRIIAVALGGAYTLVGESEDQVVDWLRNSGTKAGGIERGLFAYLNQPPVPPFPDKPVDLFALLRRHASSAIGVLAGLSITDKVTIVLAASSPSGDGLIGMTLSAPKNFDGFREGNQLRPQAKFVLWQMRSELKRTTVDRFDAAWVHGRGFNKQLPTLQAATALIIGCGSLGSQVAFRLAQSGVGGVVLVDPEVLAAANVGRHALGIASVKLHKATALADRLRGQFPHMLRIEAHSMSWQELYGKKPEIFGEATLIVACLGDWAADGQLAEWHARHGAAKPIVYGWLDEFGVASHAVALAGATPALGCVLDNDGSLRVPETLWSGDGGVTTEPACGTLFQPYGPVDLAQAEVLVSRLCIDVLTGRSKAPCHRVYAGSTTQLKDAGGGWSDEHLAYRPTGFEGAFEYERPFKPCGQCRACQALQ